MLLQVHDVCQMAVIAHAQCNIDSCTSHRMSGVAYRDYDAHRDYSTIIPRTTPVKLADNGLYESRISAYTSMTWP